MAFATVREIINVLQQLDPNLPVVVSTHYDNDIGHASEIAIAQGHIEHSEANFWTPSDLQEAIADGRGTSHLVPAVFITAHGD